MIRGNGGGDEMGTDGLAASLITESLTDSLGLMPPPSDDKEAQEVCNRRGEIMH